MGEESTLTYKRALVLQAQYAIAWQQFPQYFEALEKSIAERMTAEAGTVR